MDADRRHELRQNEFAEALSRLWDFSDKRTIAWLAVILLIALGYAGYKYWKWREQVRLNEAFRTLMTVNAADASMGDAPLARLRQLVAENTHPGLLALTHLQLAEGLEARGRRVEGASRLAEAETEYKTVLGTPDTPDVFRAPALYRLGLLYETRRDFAQARETYTRLAKDPRFDGSPFVNQALARLEQLDELAVPIAFEPGLGPPATSQPAAQASPITELPEPVREAIESAMKPTSQPGAGVAPPPAGPTRPQQP